MSAASILFYITYSYKFFIVIDIILARFTDQSDTTPDAPGTLMGLTLGYNCSMHQVYVRIVFAVLVTFLRG